MVSFGSPDDDYDYSCYSCGRGYDAGVGFGPISCPHCGGPVNKPPPTCTDAEMRERLKDNVQSALLMFQDAVWQIHLWDQGQYLSKPFTSPPPGWVPPQQWLKDILT